MNLKKLSFSWNYLDCINLMLHHGLNVGSHFRHHSKSVNFFNGSSFRMVFLGGKNGILLLNGGSKCKNVLFYLLNCIEFGCSSCSFPKWGSEAESPIFKSEKKKENMKLAHFIIICDGLKCISATVLENLNSTKSKFLLKVSQCGETRNLLSL